MSPSSFKPREKGQMSLLALVLTTLLMILALAQFQFVRLSLKAGQAHGHFPNKQVLLRDAVHQVKIQTTAQSGSIDFQDNRLSFTREEDARQLLTTENIEARFTERPHWPRPTALWVTGEGLRICVIDQRQE